MGPYQRTPKWVTRAIRDSGLGVRSVGPVGDFLDIFSDVSTNHEWNKAQHNLRSGVHGSDRKDRWYVASHNHLQDLQSTKKKNMGEVMASMGYFKAYPPWN